MDTKIRLHVTGLTLTQKQSGVYALLLGQENGNRCLPVIVSVLETQSIIAALKGEKPLRPQTHDLFTHFIVAAHYELDYVLIYKVEEGIFYSEAVFSDHNGTPVVLDSRVSDAVALALRLQAPIYTLLEVMDTYGLVFDDNVKVLREKDAAENQTVENLNKQLQKAIEEENYEFASYLRDEINKMKKKDTLPF